MIKTTSEDLRKACKKEKNPKVVKRMTAVNMVCMHGDSIRHTADSLMQCQNWVSFWVKRFEETDGDIDALRDLPKSGRKPKITRKKMDTIMKKVVQAKVMPVTLQQHIRDKTGVLFHITYVRKLMCRYNMTPKRPNMISISRADSDEVAKWRRNIKRRISRLEKKGFAVCVQDEAFFIYDAIQGRKYWSLRGVPISVPYIGKHQATAVYGAIAIDGRQMFRTHTKFNGPTFVKYLKELHRKFGKVLVIADRASPHRSKDVEKFLKENPDVKLAYFPKGSPYLNAAEVPWYRGKRDVSVSEFYPTRDDMNKAISSYFRTTRHHLDVMKYINRKYVVHVLKNI